MTKPFGTFLLQSRQAISLVPSSCAFTFPPSRKGSGNGDSYEKDNFPGPCHEFRLGDECRTSGRDRRESRRGGRAATAKQTTPVTQVWWRGGYGGGWHGGWRGGYGPGWRGGYWRGGGWVPLRPSARLQQLPAPIITTGPIMVQVRTITAPVLLMAHVGRVRVTRLRRPSNRRQAGSRAMAACLVCPDAVWSDFA